MTGRAGYVALLLMGAATAAAAQTAVSAPGGVLSGVVVDSTTGRPVGYALLLVTGSSQRVFASESGRFSLTGLGNGRLALRVQQIGYHGVSLDLVLDTRTGGEAGSGLRIPLLRQPVVLPQILVHGDVCSGVEAVGQSEEHGTILDEAFRNAERLLTLEESYPFRAVFKVEKYLLAQDQSIYRTRIDTLYYDTRQKMGYRVGRVLEGPASPRQVANYFTTSDLARESFRKAHCFWYSGRDTTSSGTPGHVIEFAPLARVKSADWAGSLLIDSVSMRLVRSEAHLVNLDPKRTDFRSATCTVHYREIVPTLMQELQLDCSSEHAEGIVRTVMERWYLVQFSFVKGRPGAAAPP